MNKIMIILGLILLLSVSFVSAYGGGAGGLILPFPDKTESMIFKHQYTGVQNYTFNCGFGYSYGLQTGNNLKVNYLCPDNYGFNNLKISYSAPVTDDLEIYTFTIPEGKLYKHHLITNAYMIKTGSEASYSMLLDIPSDAITYTGDSLKYLYRTYNTNYKKYIVITEGSK